MITEKKYRYLKILGDVVFGTNNLTRDDLARQKNGQYDCIIDVDESKQFNADQNVWIDIIGEDSA